MTFIDSARTQTATYWARSGVDNFGDPSFNAPVQILVRWVDSNEVFVNDSGEEERARSIVQLGQDVKSGDYLYLGTSAATDPTSTVGAFKVKSFRKVPSIDGTLYSRKVYL